MGIKLFHIEVDNLGSVVCAITSVILIVLAMLALIRLGSVIITEVF